MFWNKKTKIIFLLTFLAVLFLGVNIVFAQVNTGIEMVGEEIALGGEDIRIIIARIIRIFLGLLGIVIVGLIVYGGFVWMTAAGDLKKVSQAKKIITNAVIGLIIILASFALSHFILTSLIEATTKEGEVPYVPPGGPGGGFGSNVFVVRSISPSGSVLIRNVTVRVVFNQAPDSTLVESNVLITRAGVRVEGTYVTSGSVVEFTPLAACPEPNQDRKCFDAETDYHVAASNNLKSITGLSLSCGGFAPSCEADFHTGSLVDVTGPTVMIRNPAQNAILPQDSSVNLEAEAVDDGGISYVEFYVDDALVDIGAPSGGQTPLNFVASGIWNTTGATVGSHEIKAKAYDIDANNSVSASVFVNLRPAHCFNGIQDSDETGADCGGNDCGVCTNGGCQRDSDCASGSCVNGVCLELPIISGIDPKDGKEGNFVTIFGSYFGATAGQVVFLGSGDPMDDKVAPLAGCATAWQANQIVVEVPEGVVSGPIKVVASGQLEDATNDQRGPLISDFIVNNIIRPGICEVNPNSGVRGDVFVISGIQFGESQGTSQAFLADRDINPQIWSNASITGIVPAMVASTYPVRVSVGGQFSNAVNFRVAAEETGLKPVISYIDPTSGVKGDYVTIYGSNFGSATGLVIFKNKRTGDEAYGDTSFPSGCENNFWQNTSITIKVPSLFKDGRTQVTNGDYDVRVKRQDDIESAPVNFGVIEGAPRPGVCRINPNNGPAGKTAVTLFGERFGVTSGQVVFTRQKNASVSSWNDGEIRATVPVAAETGAVKVVVNSLESNSVNFTVADCNASGCGTGEQCCANGICIPNTDQCQVGPRQGGYSWRFSTGIVPTTPRVVEECADGVSPSPSPWDARRGGNDVCVNAQANVRFTVDIDQLTLNSSNILVYKCIGAAENPCAEVQEVTGAISTWNRGFAFAPSANLSPSSYYQIFLKTGIRGVGAGGGFMEEKKDECGEGFAYCFKFKTRADAINCKIGKVKVDPANYISEEMGELINYNASAISKDDICIVLNGYSYNWDWQAKEEDGSPTVKAIVLPQDANGDGKVDPWAQAQTNAETLPGPAIRIWAAVPEENRSDYGKLVIDFADPRVVEYWPKCNTACVNAEIGFKTNVVLDQNSLQENIHLFKCANESCRNLGSDMVTGIVQTEKTVVLNYSALLDASSYYRVVIDGGPQGIKSASGAEMAGANYGSNYSWIFRTRDSSEPCEIDSVSLSPESITLNYIGERASLNASAVGAPDDCNPQGQRLVATDYSWGWSVENPNVVDFYKLNNSLLNVLPRAGRINCSDICLNTGTVSGISVCGNGRAERGEDCDDGNTASADGCSNICKNEGNVLGGSICGDGIRGRGEDCDDRNTTDGDGCSHLCLNEGSTKGGSICGNGDIGDGEDCDDGNTASGDGCSADCLSEGSQTGPYPVCGNGGSLEEGEDCDDGNLLNGDGCSVNCLREGLNRCGLPTDLDCCGNNRIETGEDCDDGNGVSGDGCSARCLNEGSNIKYDSICGNGLPLQKGEECEFAVSDAKIDPFQYIIAENSGETKVKAEAQSKPGEADVTVRCVCENDLMCGESFTGQKGLGCGNEKCCYPVPTVELMVPAPGSSHNCRNTAIQVLFSREMDEASFAGNVSIYNVSGANPIDVTVDTITGLSFEIVGSDPNKKTKVSLKLKALLSANQNYQIKIFGVKSKNGVVIKNAVSWMFHVGSQICALDEVHLDPSEMYIFNFARHPIAAQGYTIKEGTLEPIEPIAGVYAWDWKWIIADTAIVNFIGSAPVSGKAQNIEVPTEVRQGDTTITVMASSTVDTVFRTTFAKSASAPITVLICENPWPGRTGRSWEPWRDENFGFSYFYCRDRGAEHDTSDDLPTINVVRVPNPPSPDILREYILTVNCSEDTPNCRKGDAIGIRINKNQEHYSPSVWYEKQGFAGSPSPIAVDGFEALQEGRTVYVNAPNIVYGSVNVYTNIYVVSYNDNASPYTLAVYNQILSNLDFLANLDKNTLDRRVCNKSGWQGSWGDWLISGNLINCVKDSDCQRKCPADDSECRRLVSCDALKTKVRRDTKRVADLRDIEERLYGYGVSNAHCSVRTSSSCASNSDCPAGETCVKKYPAVSAGTFISYYTNSKWPSWQSTLGNNLNYALPADPLNEFSAVCQEPYNPLTCFDGASNRFFCPYKSRFYGYRGQGDGSKFTLISDMEMYGLSDWEPDVSPLHSDGNYNIEGGGMCNDSVITAESGKCGDGVIGKDASGRSEVCELGQIKIESCGTNQYKSRPCASNCLSWQEAACQGGRCGDGIVQGIEACDDGSSNGKYGRCNTACTGIGPYCGDNTRNGPEECDQGFSNNGNYGAGCSSECTLPGLMCGDGVINGPEECEIDTAAQTSTDGCTIPGQVKSKQCGGNKYVCQTVIDRSYQRTCVPPFGTACPRCRLGSLSCDCGKCYSDSVDRRVCPSGITNYNVVCTSRQECSWVAGTLCVWGSWPDADGTIDAGDCAYPGACGNGVKEGIEECDDGNQVNTDGCLNNCALPRCGDGFVRQGYEMCDMGSANGNQCSAPYGGQCVYCSNNCQLVTKTGGFCGDGIGPPVQAPYEECDPYSLCGFNQINTCSYDCRKTQPNVCQTVLTP